MCYAESTMTRAIGGKMSNQSNDRLDLKLTQQVNMVTSGWQMKKIQTKKDCGQDVKQKLSETAKAQWSTDDMLTVKSDECGCEA